MSFQITVTEKEILETPNYFELGKLVNNKYWQAKRDLEGPQFDDEHVGLTINEDCLQGVVQNYEIIFRHSNQTQYNHQEC